ncbi:MAG: DUF2993 domain-containing protein [Firmicutes bacterium]|nr:DUF2993 domain-containing protein [Bacillota bacterium]
MGALAAAVAGVGVQGVVSAAAGRMLAAAVRAQWGGRVTAQVVAVPFWQLGWGRFERLTVRGRGLRSGALRIARLDARWDGGRVDLAALAQGRPLAAWMRGGRLKVRLDIGADALRRILPRSGAVTLTGLGLAPPGVWVQGRLRFDELDLPFRAFGRPRVVDGGEVLVFLVTLVHAGPIVLRSGLGVPVVDLRHTELGGALRISGARVEPWGVRVELVNRRSA